MKTTLKLALRILIVNLALLFSAAAQQDPCCGGQTYDPATEACCDDEEIYSTEENKTKDNKEDTLHFQFPEPARTLLSWAGLTLDAEVNTTLNLWEGEDCCDDGVVSYERGTLAIDGNSTPSFNIANIPVLQGFITTANGFLDDLGSKLSTGGGLNVNVTCVTTITQKWEDCERTFEGTLPITVAVNANAFIHLKSIQSGNTIGGGGLSGSVSATATIANWSTLSLTWPSDFTPSGCVTFNFDIPLVDFLDVHLTWGDC